MLKGSEANALLSLRPVVGRFTKGCTLVTIGELQASLVGPAPSAALHAAALRIFLAERGVRKKDLIWPPLHEPAALAGRGACRNEYGSGCGRCDETGHIWDGL